MIFCEVELISFWHAIYSRDGPFDLRSFAIMMVRKRVRIIYKNQIRLCWGTDTANGGK